MIFTRAGKPKYERHEKRIVSAGPRFRSIPTLARQATQRRERSGSFAKIFRARVSGVTFVMILRVPAWGAVGLSESSPRAREKVARNKDCFPPGPSFEAYLPPQPSDATP
jgi:hypothetical protein